MVIDNSHTWLFTSVDSVEGGNETFYGYPNDPINNFDLDGRFKLLAWKSVKSWVWKNKVEIALTALSFVPGGPCCASG